MVKYIHEQAKKFGVTYSQAEDIIYFRSSSKWTQELEDKMIEDFRGDNLQ